MDRQFLETQRIVPPVPTDGHQKKAQDEMIGLGRNLVTYLCKNLWPVLALVFVPRQVPNSLAPGRRTLKLSPGLDL